MSIKFYAGQYSFTMILHYQSYTPSLCKERDLYVNCFTTEPMNHDVKPAERLLLYIYMPNTCIILYTCKFLYRTYGIDIVYAFYLVSYNK